MQQIGLLSRNTKGPEGGRRPDQGWRHQSDGEEGAQGGLGGRAVEELATGIAFGVE